MRSYAGLSLHHHLMAGAAIVAVATASPAVAQTRQFNVPEQPASRGIPQFARQAGVQIIASGNTVGSRRTNAVRGSYSVEEGLRRLLEGTGLSGAPGAGGIYTIRADQSSGEATAGDAAAYSESDQTGISEILVTGSRSANVDIRRTEDDAQPYVVLEREEIQRSGATNVEDFLRTRLPMNAQQRASTQSNSSALGNFSNINLRGLGTAETVILIDGRRPAPNIANTTSGSYLQTDINGLSLGSIERIEILSSTAAGIYGGGATGGVVNIITRRDYNGVELNANYGSSFRGDAQSRQLSIVGGLSLNEGRTRVTFSAGLSEADPLRIGDRSFAQDARNLQFQSNPAGILGAPTPILGATPNIRSQNGQNLVLRNGTSLNSPITFVPYGYGGALTDGGAALVTNAGRYNLDIPPDGYGRGLYFLGDRRQASAALGVRQEITAELELFGDARWTENANRTRTGPLSQSATLPANAPNNPFTTAVTISYAVPGIEAFLDTRGTTLNFTGGVIYRPSARWAISAEHSWSRSATSVRSTNPVFNSTLTPAVTSGAYDVTRDLGSGLIEAARR